MTCEQHLALALELCEQLLVLTSHEREACEHDDCLLLDGVVRDCAMKMRQEALRCRHGIGKEDESTQWAQ